jgi:hypothetical protein
MKVLPFKIPKSEKDALIYQEDTGVAFYEQLHQHEEMQISYIVKGSGTLIVGDSISVFNENDILVIGENLPHVFRTDYDLSTNAEMLTLFFTKASLGRIFQLNDLNIIDDFLKSRVWYECVGFPFLVQFKNIHNLSTLIMFLTLLGLSVA